MADLKHIYTQRITGGEQRLNGISKNLWLISILRFSTFIVTLVVPFLLYPVNPLFGVLLPMASFIAFFFLVKKYQKISKQKRFEQVKIELNTDELKSLEHQFSHFDSGKEFINPHHVNSYDLDLFGDGSLFQFLNRTVTFKGKIRLAKMIQEPILVPSQIEKRQNLIKELSGLLDWRENFTANGKLYTENETESKLFHKWGTQHFELKVFSWVKVLMVLLPAVALGSIVFWVIEGNSALFLFSLMIQAFFWYYDSATINKAYSQFGKRVDVLEKYGVLLSFIEKHNWQSAEGKENLDNLRKNGLPSLEIEKLKRIISLFDNRNNLLLGVILNLLLFWDIWCTYRLINWHRKNQQNYSQWIETIAFFDACNSLANYTHNHPEFSFPEFCQNEFKIESERMGHPIIHPKKMIPNNFSMEGVCQTIIITGANMSGKSTFLRTIGVNMVLGMSGAPVCAHKMKFKPVVVFSNMRTTDSLFDDESYFFAELKRLKFILDEVDKGKEMLIILDEILKGTNSVDKLYGSQKLVQRMVSQKCTTIIATHDLKLTEIEKEFPQEISNRCFEITIENDEMQFDYQLRDGVTTIMNASFLMKKMGIIQ